jgi:DNA invertase Pin-like site-specific DNA recombinase
MPIPVAQYLRMSTEDQQYSIANQRDKILDYAAHHDFSIARTYSDAGRSGVVLKYRRGLKELLRDVIGGKADYKAILAYDVSRWGRFQNPDEAAHYEFICDHAGIPIHYCAEQFKNDGTMPSLLLKALKRTMAAEYSRELSVKVYEGKKRIAEMGYRVGGMDLYGLRRMVITKKGRKRYLLARGERKGIPTDRIILVPGRKNEVKYVRNIFHAAAYDGKSPREITDDLKQRKIKYIQGREWSGDSVWRALATRNTRVTAFGIARLGKCTVSRYSTHAPNGFLRKMHLCRWLTSALTSASRNC